MRRRDEKFPDNGFEAWGGYMNAKIAKLEEQFCHKAGGDEKLSNIFNGVSIYVNGFTIPSSEELKELMSKHGGVYHTYQRSEDFIIASNLPDTKVKNMSLAKVVKPEWITDSISANGLLDYKNYLLYRNSRTQPQLNFSKCVKNELPKVESSSSVLESKVPLKSDETFVSHNKTTSPGNIVNSCDKNIKEIQNIPSISHLNTDSTKESDLKKSEHSTKTAADPNFISEFYNNSRLHHISQLGACFKQHVNDLRENSNFEFPARTQFKEKVSAINNLPNLTPLQFEKGKTIMHIDMDCFFVSVGLRNRPDLRGKPVAVTHSKGGQTRPKRPGVDRNTEFNLYRQKQAKKLSKVNGQPEDEIEFESRVDNIADEDDKYGSMSEIASCSYEARAKGLKNGMFMGPALRLCPDLQTIPYDFEGYKEVAYTLYNTVAQYTLDIEAVSCDEMYVDCTELLKDMNVSVQDFATVLRSEISEKTGCPCSTGFGGNRLQARLATKKAKPDGQFFLTADLVEDFMIDIKLKDLPGVGRQIAHKLESIGHDTCGSLQSLSLVTLQHHLGNKTGSQLFDQCRGRDLNPLSFHTVRKSVSAEVNYGIRFDNNDQCVEFLKQLSAEVHLRMQQFKVVGKCITLKLMVRAEGAPVETAKFMGHGFCNVINKSTSLNNATNDADVITREVIAICKKQNIDPKEMRGIGIQVTKLESIINKPTKGAISKFLSTVKPAVVEEKIDCLRNDKREIAIDNKIDIEKPTLCISPKRLKVPSPPKQKSPTVGVLRSPAKRRGRPPKNARSNQSTSRNLMNKFLQGSSTSLRDTPYKDPMVKKAENVSVKDKKESIVEEIQFKREIEEKPKGLLALPWEKIRELLRAWLESGQTPLPCDVNMIAEYLRNMVLNRNIDKLYILLNFLKRRTHEMGNVSWTEVFDHIIEQVQNTMLAVYGKRLYIN